ncbi:MAG TPA: hypothetical protein VLQ89_03415, partial [Candidatus Binatia bacterium]|nr:hypothetical protein [Candidatus Binatia bacterium]
MIKLKWAVVPLLFMFILHGCQVTDDDSDPGSQVLVSYNKITTTAISQQLLDQILSAFQEFQDQTVQNWTVYNVHVYRVVYKTTHKGVETQASGACFIPETNGVAVP